VKIAKYAETEPFLPVWQVKNVFTGNGLGCLEMIDFFPILCNNIRTKFIE
jgi:hypothetical protein